MNAIKKFSRAWIAVVVIALSFSNYLFADSNVSRSGTFTGMNNHVTTGMVEVTKTDTGYIVKLGADFTFDGAPDPKVALGKDGVFDPATLAEPLRSLTGEQSYTVPSTVDFSEYNEVYIWCEKFTVGLGVAVLK